MARGVWWSIVGIIVLLGVLAGCAGRFSGEREPWRRDAEVACLNSGAVREGAGKVRISAINGPGMCGADFPMKVSALGEGATLGYGDELRPPAAIPNASTPRWPVRPSPQPRYETPYEPRYETPQQQQVPASAVESRPLPAPSGVAPRYRAPDGPDLPMPLDPPA